MQLCSSSKKLVALPELLHINCRLVSESRLKRQEWALLGKSILNCRQLLSMDGNGRKWEMLTSDVQLTGLVLFQSSTVFPRKDCVWLIMCATWECVSECDRKCALARKVILFFHLFRTITTSCVLNRKTVPFCWLLLLLVFSFGFTKNVLVRNFFF